MSAAISLPVSQLVRRSDARQLDGKVVSAMAESIAAIGLLNPVRVRKAGEQYEVIAGAHRLAAHQLLGLVEIECVVVHDDDLRAELAMIDENLCRAELSPSDRARQTARRKAIYLELHPETAPVTQRGGPGRGKTTDNLSAVSFATETAIATGKDERTVRRDAERGEKVIDEVLDLIRGTKLDTGTYLDKLKKLPPNEQIAAAKHDLAVDKKEEKAERDARQAEFDRQQAAVRETLPDDVKAYEARKVEAVARRGASKEDDAARIEFLLDEIEELRNVIADQKSEIDQLRDALAKYDDMAVEYERGGFEEVISGLNQRIANLQRQVERESAEKVKNLRSADRWRKKAIKAGANDDIVIDRKTGEASRG